MGDTVSLLIQESPRTRFVFTLTSDKGTFGLDTAAIQETLEDVPIESYEIRMWIRDYVNEGVSNIFGGVLNEIVGGT